MKPATVTLQLSDWQHILHAIESSFVRKVKRGDVRAADEMQLIGLALARQCKDHYANASAKKGEQ